MPRGLYDEMRVHAASELWYIWPDGLVTPGETRPTHEQLVAAYMSIPHYVCTRDANGRMRQSGPTHASRDEAERSVALFEIPQATENAA